MTNFHYGFALFDTAIGECCVVWNKRGIVRTRLPEGGARAARDQIARRYPAARETAPPDEIKRAIDDMIALLGGEPKDLTGVKIDTTDVPDFNRQVYNIARTIPAGATMTYGQIAERLGDRRLSRDVGQALGQNPFPIIVPCHRAGGGRQDRWLFRAGRGQHENAHADHRRRATQRAIWRRHVVRPIASVRSIAVGGTSSFTTPPAGLKPRIDASWRLM